MKFVSEASTVKMAGTHGLDLVVPYWIFRSTPNFNFSK